MGVSGLTSYLSRHGEKYKQKIYVSHQPVVIDGNNLMFYLYSTYDVKKYNHHLFGGDCILFAQAVRQYFQKLKCCSIYPIVIFDGAYVSGKLKTRMKRFAQSLKENVRQSQPGKSYTTTLMKDIVVEILGEQNIDHFQTEFEADDTVAYIAMQLSCPVLSSDSDFFIYANVTTIPFGTINFKKRQTKNNSKKAAGGESSSQNLSSHVLEGKCIILQQMCKEEFNLSDRRLLPLTAVVLGNDQISTTVFTNFMAKKSEHISNKGRQLRIAYLVKWFSKQRSYESAQKILLDTLKAVDRDHFKALIDEIVANYMGAGGEEYIWNLVKSSRNLVTFLEVNVPEKRDILDRSFGAAQQQSETSKNESINADESLNFGDLSICDSFNNMSIQDSDVDTSGLNGSDDDEEDDSDDEVSSSEPLKPNVPPWFLESLCKCKFPTPVCKILYNKTVYLTPQVEVTHMPSSHAISVPIIQVLGGILYGTGAVTLVSRDKYNPVKLDVPTITSFGSTTLPSVVESPNDFRETLPHDKRLKILLQALLIKPEEEAFIHEWPPYIKFWIVCCIYYLRKLKKTKDLYIGVTVSISIILSCLKNYSFTSTNIKARDGEDTNEDQISSLLRAQPADKATDKLMNGFTSVPDSHSRSFWKNYDMARVFFYSQFHSVVFHAQTLNLLLGEPLRSPKYSILNCNMVYNICTSVADTFHGHVNLFLDKHLESNSPLKKVLLKFIRVALQGGDVVVPDNRELRNAKKEQRKSKQKQKNEEGEEGDTSKLNRFMVLEAVE